MDNDICLECRVFPIEADGLCEECLTDLRQTLAKMDEWLMDNT
jgi:hypothetical protein